MLHTNLNGNDPAKLWEYYLQLTEIEQAFKELKGDLATLPIEPAKWGVRSRCNDGGFGETAPGWIISI